MYARLFFLTLRVPDNLPEIRKRQYENKGGVRASRRNHPIADRQENKNLALLFSAKRNAARNLTRCNIGKQLKWQGFAGHRTDRRLARGLQARERAVCPSNRVFHAS
jgi:hypothetical protein